MKVLHIETGRHLYGGPQQVLYLLDGLSARGIDNALLCARETPFAELAARRGDIDHRQIALAGDLDLTAVGRIRRSIRDVRPDLIHIHSRRGADTLGGLAGKLEGVPMVLSRRVDNPESPLALRYKYDMYRHVIAISDKIRDVLLGQGLDASRVSVVRSAVAYDDFAKPRNDDWLKPFGLYPEQPLIGMLAQFIERKGHVYLVDAFAQVVARVPEAKLVFFGKGPTLRSVRERVRKHRLIGRVIFAGFRHDLSTVLPSLDVVAHPALMEGLGVSLLQAASAGVPVVASRVGGIPEAVADGESGLLVPPGDVSALADAILRLLQDPNYAQTLGQCGARLMRENYSPEKMVEGNLAVYKKALA